MYTLSSARLTAILAAVLLMFVLPLGVVGAVDMDPDVISIMSAKGALAGSGSPSGTMRPAQGTDSSVITMAQSIIADPTVTVSMLSTANSHVNNLTGAITYDATAETNSVTLHLSKNAAVDDQVMSVVVPAAAPDYASIFGDIKTALAVDGINTNIDLCATTPTACTGLYFQKLGKGKILFEQTLDLTSSATITALQNIGTAMELTNGHIQFDSATAAAMNAVGARIFLEGLPYENQPNLVVKDDAGVVLDPAGIVSGLQYTDPVGACEVGKPICKVLSFSAAHFTQFDAQNTDIYVTAAGDNANDGTASKPVKTIAYAVSITPSGGTVHVEAGTYNESVLITKPLTLAGTGGTTIVTGSGSGQNYIIKIDTAVDVTIEGIEVNGGGAQTGDNALAYGIMLNAAGTSAHPVTIKNTTVKNIWQNGSNGIGIEATSYALVQGATISTFHKRGVRFVNSAGKVSGSIITGDDVDGTQRVQNLITVWGGSTVEAYENTLSGGRTSGTPTWSSTAVFLSSYGGSGASTLDLHDNTISNTDTGVTVGSTYAGTDTSTATISNNTLHDVAAGVSFEKSTVTASIHENSFGAGVPDAVTYYDADEDGAVSAGEAPAAVDAARNWWNAASGPKNAVLNTAGTGDAIYEAVAFSPWYADSSMTKLAFTTKNDTTDSGDVDLTGSADAAGAVTYTIPAGTVITGGTGWDGTLAPLTVTTTYTLTPDSGKTATAVEALAIGAGDVPLTFSSPVQLVFSGQAGKYVGWSRAGTFTPITTVCAANDAETNGALPAGGDCKIDVGADLIVWTKHFTTFVVYTQTTNSSSGSGSTGGGNGPIVGSLGTTNSGTTNTGTPAGTDANAGVAGSADVTPQTAPARTTQPAPARTIARASTGSSAGPTQPTLETGESLTPAADSLASAGAALDLGDVASTAAQYAAAGSPTNAGSSYFWWILLLLLLGSAWWYYWYMGRNE